MLLSGEYRGGDGGMLNAIAGGDRRRVVDGHHHLWRYNAAEYGWIDERMRVLQQDFVPDHLDAAMRSAGVDVSVAVQARQTLEETRMLLTSAAHTTRIAAVVGWLPLGDAAGLAAALKEFAGASVLAGARHVVQGEPAGFLDDAAFNEGLHSITEAGLSYDLLIRADQLSEATRFVDRHGETRFVLDHMAKPLIAAGVLEPWASDIRELAQRPNVFCKVSGMVTEAAWDRWSLADLRPYLDIVIEAFGTERLMAGSDWPVCLVASSYAQWWTALRTYFAAFTDTQRDGIFGGNAEHFYRLTMPHLNAEVTG